MPGSPRCTGAVQPYTATIFASDAVREGDRRSDNCLGAYTRTMPSRQCHNRGKYPCAEHGGRCHLHRCKHAPVRPEAAL